MSKYSEAFKWGAISGLIGLVYYLLLFILSPVYVAGSFLPVFVYVFVIALMVFGCIQQRKVDGGYIKYGKAFLSSFIVAVISVVAMSVFTYILYNFIDPNLTNIAKEASVEITVKFMEWFGAPESAIDDAIEKAEAQDYSLTIVKQLGGIFSGSIIGAIISLIVAAIVKRKKPEELIAQEASLEEA